MFKKTFKFFRKYYLDYFLVFLLAFLTFFYIQSPPALPDPDSFYHAKMAELTLEKGVIQDFPWAQYSTLSTDYIDHHFLYHLYLSPFTRVFDPLIGAKVATIFLDVILVLFIYFFLTHFKIKGRFFWILFLLTVNPFLFRISLVKAPVLSIIFLLLGFYAFVNYKRWLLFWLSFFYVWAYAGWPLLWVILVLYFGVDFLYEKLHKKTIFWQTVQIVINHVSPHKKKQKRWKLLGVITSGTILGLVINPYFPKNIYFYYQQIYQIAVVNLQKVIGVGGEWYPYGLSNLLKDLGVMTPILVVAVIVFFISWRRQSRLSTVLFFLTLFFFAYTLKARRSVEYLAPFGLLFSAFSFSDFFKLSWLNFEMAVFKQFKWFKNVVTGAIIAVLVLIIIYGFQSIASVRQDIKNGISIFYFKNAGQWLANNTPPQTIVLHSDWDEFPMLLYWSDNNYYINGLDQTFMYNYNKNLFWQWVQITQGQKVDNFESVVKEDFKASYVLIETTHQAMNNLFKYNQGFNLVYQDNEAYIYQAE